MVANRLGPAVLRAALVLGVALVASPDGFSDTVVLKHGRDLEDVVVSRMDDEVVIVNPWNSRNPDMTWEIPEKNRIPRDKVEKVIIQDPPWIELRRREVEPEITVEDRLALFRFCEEHKFRKEATRQLELVLSVDPTNATALDAYGGEARWRTFARGNPEADPALREMERAYLGLEDPDDLADKLEEMREAGSKRPVEVLERARRSAGLPRGLREKVPLTLSSEEAPGATYCLYVPRSYDPLRPTPLVVALHGGGRGAVDETIVTGSGEQAMPFYQEEAKRWGWIVVCPTALAAPWQNGKNEPWIDALLAEMTTLYNIDETRIYLTGHSMGGFGTWYWGPKRADVWAAISPCAGGGGPAGVDSKGLPVYIYHGTDDKVVPPTSDRNAARALAGGRHGNDFVYTELDGVGHGFPASVRKAIFRFFAGRRKDQGRRHAIEPVSSFDRKVTREEITAFGNPRKLPEADASSDLGDLIDALERGGGGAEEAVAALGARKDPKAVRAVARVLRSKRSSVDVRVHACEALGAIGLGDGIKPLEKALRSDDYRVLTAAVAALGKTALPEAAEGIVEGTERLAALFEESVRGGGMPFREYEVRLEDLGVAVEASGRVPVTPELLGAIRKEVVERVYLRDEPLTIHGEEDPRFRRNPSEARLRLARALVGTLRAWGSDDGFALLDPIAKAWRERQPDLARLMEDARKQR